MSPSTDPQRPKPPGLYLQCVSHFVNVLALYLYLYFVEQWSTVGWRSSATPLHSGLWWGEDGGGRERPLAGPAAWHCVHIVWRWMELRCVDTQRISQESLPKHDNFSIRPVPTAPLPPSTEHKRVVSQSGKPETEDLHSYWPTSMTTTTTLTEQPGGC